MSSPSPPVHRPYRFSALLVVFLVPALGGFLFGYDIGATSYVITQLGDPDYSGTTWYGRLRSCEEDDDDNAACSDSAELLSGLVVAAAVAGALVGSLGAFWVGDTLGRRKELVLASVLYGGGAAVQFLAANGSWGFSTGLSVLLAGRLVYGLAIGFAMHSAPAYIAEMSPPSIRGMLVSGKEGFIVLGMLAGYAFGYAFSETEGAWRYTYGIAAVAAGLMFLGATLALPFSARWLILQNRVDEARASLAFLHPDAADVDALLKDMLETTQELDRAGNGGDGDVWGKLFSPACKRALVAGVGLVVLQQITGQPSVLYYANSIFEDAGLASYSAVIVGGWKLVATAGSVVLVDRYGRKFLLFAGCATMLAALLVLTVASYPGLNPPNILVLLAMFAYIGGYQIGFGPIAWLIISEVFPLDVRGPAVSVAVVSNFFWNLVVTFAFKSEIKAIGDCATFAIFAALTLYSIVFVHYHVPETRGLTLEQIEVKLNKQGGAKDQSHGAKTSAGVPLLGEVV